MPNLSAALPTFVVTLREGFEAALVVGIVLACLQKAQQTQLYRWVYQGIGGGIVASVMVGISLAGLLQGVEAANTIYSPIIKEILAGLFGIVAIAMLSWMLIWMTQQAKSLKGEVEGSIRRTLEQNSGVGKGVFLLVFIAVLREGFETVLFILAMFQEDWLLPTGGAIVGLSLASAMGFLLFRWGIKINIRLFFQVMGIFLLLIVGGLVVGVFKHIDLALAFLTQLNLGYDNWCFYGQQSCILGPQVWDASSFLPDREFPGILLKSLFGYRQQIYLVQIVAYVLFLVTVGAAYLRSLSSQTAPKIEQKTFS